MPPLSQVHIDTALTNVAILYKNDVYIADDALPILPVGKRSDVFFRFKKEAALTGTLLDGQGRPLSYRAPGTDASESDYEMDKDSYICEEYAKRLLVDDAQIQAADQPLTPEITATEIKTEELKIDNEVMAAQLMCTRANYPSTNKAALSTGATGTSWAQYASPNSNPLGNIQSARLQIIRSIAKAANTLLAGSDTILTLLDHPVIQNLVKYTHSDALTMSGMPKTVRGLDVLEGPAQRNTLSPGQGYSGQYVWDADDGSAMALVYYRNPSPALMGVSFGYTFEAPDQTTNTRGYSVRKWREEKRKGVMVEVSTTRTWKGIAVDSNNKLTGGYLFTSTTA